MEDTPTFRRQSLLRSEQQTHYYEQYRSRTSYDRIHSETIWQKVLRITGIMWLYGIVISSCLYVWNYISKKIAGRSHRYYANLFSVPNEEGRWYIQIYRLIRYIIYLVGRQYYRTQCLFGYLDVCLLTFTSSRVQNSRLTYILMLILLPLLLLSALLVFAEIAKTGSLPLKSSVQFQEHQSNSIYPNLENVDSNNNYQKTFENNFMTVLNDYYQQLNKLKDEYYFLKQQFAKLNSKFIMFSNEQKEELNSFINQKDSKNIHLINEYDTLKLSQNDLNKGFEALKHEHDTLTLSQNDFNKRFEALSNKIGHFIATQNIEKLKFLELQKKSLPNLGSSEIGLSQFDVQKIVENAIALYDADKIGLVDYALETAGGFVLSTRCTESYNTKSLVYSIMGIPFWYSSISPRTVINTGVIPGECWSFQNFPGFLVIGLSSQIHVTGFSLEHISKKLSPTGKIDSAPQNFSVWGLTTETDDNPFKLGQYIYNADGPPLQYFIVKQTDTPSFNMIELRIESNHGHQNYTCLYRFRVHGKLAENVIDNTLAP